MCQTSVPADFPRGEQPGAVPGAQLKYLARQVDGKFIVGPTDEEVRGRYEACEDFARQFASYACQYLGECSGLSLDEILGRVQASITNKVRSGKWVLSTSEIDWILNHVLKIIPASGAPGEGPCSKPG